MRVLLVVHGFPPAASGGTEIYVSHFARALAALPATDVVVLTRDADPDRPEYSLRTAWTPEGVRVFRINNTFQACTSFVDSYANPSLARIAQRLIEDIDPDVLHVQHLTCLSTGLLDPSIAGRRPIVMTLNDYWLMCHRGQLFRRDGTRCDGAFETGCASCIPRGVLASPAVYRAARVARASPIPVTNLLRRAERLYELTRSAAQTRHASWTRLQHMRSISRGVDVFLAPSRTMEEWALRFGIERSRLERCNQGIDLDPFNRELQCRPYARAGRLPLSSEPLRLVCAGSLIPSKAPHLLLEAVAALPPGRVSVDLLGAIAPYHGDSTYASRLAPLLGKPFIRKLGPIPHERMADALADAHALVVPSDWIENAPFIIREAFAAGLPVIASNLGGMAEMVRHEHDGLLFDPGSAEDLAAQMSRLLDEPGLLEGLRKGIRRPMSIEEDAESVRARYEGLLHDRRKVHVCSEWLPPSGGRTGFSVGSTRRVTAVVLNYRTPDQTWLAVRSIQASTVAATTFVVDNASNDGSAERLADALPTASIISATRNLGFSGGCNVGIRAALADGATFILLVNSDAVLSRQAIETLLDAMRENPDVGILAPVILSREEPDRMASAGIRFSVRTGRMRHIGAGQPISLLPPGPVITVDAVSGCVMLIRREVFEKVGLLDEAFFFGFEDIEFCLRARGAGFGVLCVPEALAYHEGGRSIGRTSPERVYFATRNHLRTARMVGPPYPPGWLRSGLIVGLNAGYVLLSGDTPRVRGLAALARGVWHHIGRRYGAS